MSSIKIEFRDYFEVKLLKGEILWDSMGPNMIKWGVIELMESQGGPDMVQGNKKNKKVFKKIQKDPREILEVQWTSKSLLNNKKLIFLPNL